jgi:hypothetical protein
MQSNLQENDHPWIVVLTQDGPAAGHPDMYARHGLVIVEIFPEY